MLQHKGYTGVVEFDPLIKRFTGYVIDLRADLYFEGRSVDEIQGSFEAVVDDYLDWCDERGEEPDRPFSGQIRLRMPPAVHRAVVIAAATGGHSMNEWIVGVLRSATGEPLHPA